MSKPIKIVGLVVTKDTVTLYDENFKSHLYHQGTSEIVFIREQLIPEFNKNGVAYFNPEESNTIYSTFESKSKIVKFFSMAADKFKQYFQKDNSGQLSAQLRRLLESDRTGLQKLKNPDSGGIEPRQEEVSIAVINDTVIPNIDKLAMHINHANETGNGLGFENLLMRLTKIIDTQDHNVEDVITFLEKSDLPITNNGDILVYKGVKKDSDTVYKDCHTGNVKQSVGSLVQVPHDYVDKNRLVDCAQGLHVARRSYLSGFIAETCLLCVVRPEDIIAVPHKDANKVRVRAYHIIDVLTADEYKKLLNNTSFIIDATSEAKYNRAIYNSYPTPTNTVTVQGTYGTDIVYTVIGDTPEPIPVIDKPVINMDQTKLSLAERNKQTIKISSVKNTQSFASKDMFKLIPCTNYTDAMTLKAWKKYHRKSWTKLGLNLEDIALIQYHLNKGI